MRRLVLFIEESIVQGTTWLVFEQNDERLWSDYVTKLKRFLTAAWEDGMLIGKTPEESFFVKCDRETMTQEDIDNGRLKAVVGLAPLKPAEFISLST